jgi:hypothetical protein
LSAPGPGARISPLSRHLSHISQVRYRARADPGCIIPGTLSGTPAVPITGARSGAQGERYAESMPEVKAARSGLDTAGRKRPIRVAKVLDINPVKIDVYGRLRRRLRDAGEPCGRPQIGYNSVLFMDSRRPLPIPCGPQDSKGLDRASGVPHGPPESA